MRALLAAILLAAAPAAAADPPDLAAGRYAVGVRGMVGTVCARAIAHQWAALPQVEAVAPDYDHERLIVTVRLDKTLRVRALRSALGPAAKLANLGGRYELGEIEYLR